MRGHFHRFTLLPFGPCAGRACPWGVADDNGQLLLLFFRGGSGGELTLSVEIGCVIESVRFEEIEERPRPPVFLLAGVDQWLELDAVSYAGVGSSSSAAR